MLHLSPRFTETFESLPNPLSPLLQGEMSRSDRGGSAAAEQRSAAIGNPLCLRHLSR